MIDKNKVYKTRDGREVRIYATDGYGGAVHGSVFYDDMRYGLGWRAREWTLEGGYNSNNLAHDLDLIEVKPRIKREVWVNVYPEGFGMVCESKEKADIASGAECKRRIACVKLTIDVEEGEGL